MGLAFGHHMHRHGLHSNLELRCTCIIRFCLKMCWVMPFAPVLHEFDVVAPLCVTQTFTSCVPPSPPPPPSFPSFSHHPSTEDSFTCSPHVHYETHNEAFIDSSSMCK